MPIPLGVLAVAGAGGAGGGSSFDLLETTIVGTPTSSVTFSSLGSYSAYKHLQIRATVQGSDSAFLRIHLNNTSGGTSYAAHRLQGDGSSVSGQNNTGNDRMVLASLPTTGNESNTFMGWVVDVLDFSSSSKNTTVRVLAGNAQASYRRIGLYSGLWADTSAVTSIILSPATGTLATNSRFSLYGIK
jgi:hypothetical protein